MDMSTKATKEDGEYIAEHKIIYSADKTKLIKGNLSLKAYSPISECEIICDRAFFGNKELASIELPESLTHIGNKAFAWCINLKGIAFPKSLTYIGDGAVSYCPKLHCVDLYSTLTHIGKDAFFACKDLEIIFIPTGTKRNFEELLSSELHEFLREKQ